MTAVKPQMLPLARRVGARVHALRKRQGWSQVQLAQKTGYGRAAIASIETGRILPSLEKVLDLAVALGVRAGILFEEEPHERDTPPPLVEPVPTWSPAERRAMLRSLRRLVEKLEEVEPPA